MAPQVTESRKSLFSPATTAKIGAGVLALATMFTGLGMTGCDLDGGNGGGGEQTDPTKIADVKIGMQTIAIHVATGVTLTTEQITALKTELPNINTGLLSIIAPRFKEINKIEVTGISTNGG